MIVRPFRSTADRIQGRLRHLSILLCINAAFLAQTFHGFAQTSSSVTLAWNRSSSSGISGYRVYYGIASRTYTNRVDAGSSTNATISGLKAGVNYYFAATDYTTNGTESAYSTEVTYTPSSASPATAPSITLSSPVGGSVYAAPANISLAASVVTNGHTISRVQFFDGSTLLAADTVPPYSFVWSKVAAGTYTLTAQLIYDGGSTLASAPISVTVNPQAQTGLTFASTSGTISAPFISGNGLVYQSVSTGVTNGGRAAYTVTIPATDSYLVSAMVVAPNTSSNSFYVNFDSEPTDPTMIWDVPVTTTLASETVAWRGNGDATTSQFSPRIFNLTQGTHQLIIRGREPYTQLGTISIAPLSNSTPPAIVLSSPANGASFQAPATVTMAATVTPNGHTITKVQMFNGSTLLVEDTVAPYSFTWTNVAAGTYALSAAAVYDSGSTVPSAPVNVVVSAPSSTLSFAATFGQISSPFTSANGFVSQSVNTGVTNGGRAAYTFTVNSTGDYLISAIVNAPNTTANSFYVNVDAEPADPTMIWDIPLTSGSASRAVSWRGNGTPDGDQFAPKVFNLAQGTHQLIIRGREANTQLGNITIAPAVQLPSPWQAIDIGAVGVTGSSTTTNGVYSISGAGVLGGTSDSCRFLYQPMTGDGEIRAKLNSVQNTGTGARIGLLIRETLTPGALCSFLGISPDGTIRIQNRASTSGSTTSASSGVGTLPNIWLRLVRTGNTFNSFTSADGVNWTQVNSTSVTMAANIYFGFVVSSGQAGVLNASSLSNTTVIP